MANQVIKLKMFPYFDIAHCVLCTLHVREDLGPGELAPRRPALGRVSKFVALPRRRPPSPPPSASPARSLSVEQLSVTMSHALPRSFIFTDVVTPSLSSSLFLSLAFLVTSSNFPSRDPCRSHYCPERNRKRSHVERGSMRLHAATCCRRFTERLKYSETNNEGLISKGELYSGIS